MIIRVSNHATEFGLPPSKLKGVFGNEDALRFLPTAADERAVELNAQPCEVSHCPRDAAFDDLTIVS